jgi:hypothetical protein
MRAGVLLVPAICDGAKFAAASGGDDGAQSLAWTFAGYH